MSAAPDDVADAKLAAQIADAETQFRHFQAERLRLWALAREHGWSYARIADAAGLNRTGIHRALKLAGMLPAPSEEEADDVGA